MVNDAVYAQAIDKMSSSIAIKASRLSELKILLRLILYLSRATDHSDALSQRFSIQLGPLREGAFIQENTVYKIPLI